MLTREASALQMYQGLIKLAPKGPSRTRTSEDEAKRWGHLGISMKRLRGGEVQPLDDDDDDDVCLYFDLTSSLLLDDSTLDVLDDSLQLFSPLLSTPSPTTNLSADIDIASRMTLTSWSRTAGEEGDLHTGSG